MNTFIILLNESYDEYMPMVPHIIQTNWTKEMLEKQIEERKKRCEKLRFEIWRVEKNFVLGDTEMLIDIIEVGKILTVEEFTVEWKNKRINSK